MTDSQENIQYNSQTPLVSVVAPVYKHGRYLEDFFRGILMQKTTFPYEVLIHDDASTDNSQEIIRRYAKMRPDLIRPILQKENQYSRGRKICLDFLFPRARGKYIAFCEGDDCWIAEDKLQRQWEFMEKNPEYTFVGTGAKIRTPDGWEDGGRFDSDTDLRTEDIIAGGGLYIQTATYFFRKDIFADYPDCCRNCPVDDYAYILWAALKGKCRYLAFDSAVYRYGTPGSWSEQNNIARGMAEKKLPAWEREIAMLLELNRLSGGRYENAFYRKAADYILSLEMRYLPDFALIERELGRLFPGYTNYLSEKDKVRVRMARIHMYGVYDAMSKLRRGK